MGASENHLLSPIDQTVRYFADVVADGTGSEGRRNLNDRLQRNPRFFQRLRSVLPTLQIDVSGDSDAPNCPEFDDDFQGLLTASDTQGILVFPQGEPASSHLDAKHQANRVFVSVRLAIAKLLGQNPDEIYREFYWPHWRYPASDISSGANIIPCNGTDIVAVARGPLFEHTTGMRYAPAEVVLVSSFPKGLNAADYPFYVYGPAELAHDDRSEIHDPSLWWPNEPATDRANKYGSITCVALTAEGSQLAGVPDECQPEAVPAMQAAEPIAQQSLTDFF